MQTDVLIIGAGLAGVSVALNLPSNLRITILSKDTINECSSYYAQGGIAGMLAADDCVTAHVKDTLIAGDGLCHPANTGQILQQGVSAIHWLCDNGVPFTKNGKDDVSKNKESQSEVAKPDVDSDVDAARQDLHLTREGGHSHRRIVHAADATGKHIMDALLVHVKNQDNIQILEQHEAIELITKTVDLAEGTRDSDPQNCCRGAVVLNKQTNAVTRINAHTVVLASGGLGQVFKRATAPDVCVGDGVMMAWQAGCRVANLEFVQFHPTGLALDNFADKQVDKARNFLISEAVRGEGGMLYCPVTGKRFMLKIDERAELAPRDIVARAIHKQGQINGLGYVHLDITQRSPEFIKSHFPQIYEHCLQQGIDITKDPIPVAPTAHYSCGGVLTTAEGLTDVVGLYAAGEVGYTGLHGANRLASNSLLECIVVGKQVAKHLRNNLPIASFQSKIDENTVDKQDDLTCAAALINSWHIPQPQVDESDVLVVHSTDKSSLPTLTKLSETFSKDAKYEQLPIFGDEPIESEVLAEINVEQDSYKQKVAELKNLMNDYMGIERSHASLLKAYGTLEEWQQAAKVSLTDRDVGGYVASMRWYRLILLAKLMIQCALSRQESRGGHYRSDYLQSSTSARVSVVH